MEIFGWEMENRNIEGRQILIHVLHRKGDVVNRINRIANRCHK